MINKKKGPGRPQKKFAPPVKVKQAGPGRPKKVAKTYDVPASRPSLKGFVTKNILHAPKKDNIILLMFVLSLCLFIFSLYVAVLKGQKNLEAQQLITAPTQDTPLVDIQTGSIPYQATGNQAPQEVTSDATPTIVPNHGADQIVGAFYDAINAKDFSAMNALVDKPLKAADVYKTYYSKNWLTQFLSHVPQGIQVQNLQLKPRPEGSAAQMLTYTLVYTRDDGKSYTEDRSAVLVRRNTEYKIGKIMCTTVKCSQLPFFNIAKYAK